MFNLNQTKIIWSLTQQVFQQKSIDDIASFFVKEKLCALRMTYTKNISSKLSQLRQKISENSLVQENLPKEGLCPFILEFVGRAALVTLAEKEKVCSDGDILSVTFQENFQNCATGVLFSTYQKNSTSSDFHVLISAKDMLKDLKVGSFLSFSYGAVEMKIERVTLRAEDQCLFQCKVVSGGTLKFGMEVHSPDISRDLFPLLPQDAESLENEFGNLADYLVVSGIQSLEELSLIQKKINKNETGKSVRHPTVPIQKNIYAADGELPPKILLKIDSKKSLDFLKTSLVQIDGVFLSRSELGLDIHPNELPIIQKEVISLCNKSAKSIVIASELMQSMSVNINPTRAEVSDVSNAAFDGADALVISHDVTEGENSAAAIQVTLDTLKNAEAWIEKKWLPYEKDFIQNDDDVVTYGAVRMAENCRAKAIVCFTEGGYTAVRLASMKTPIPVIALTFNHKIMRQLQLLRGMIPVCLEKKEITENLLLKTKEILCQNFSFEKGDSFVFISLSKSTVSEKNSNLFSFLTID